MIKRPARKKQSPSGVITLTTDFGCQDTYAGIMKGVIFGIAPEAKIVDLTHSIPPYQIIPAALRIRQAYNYFPKGTIHLVVIDPGVGGKRRAVAMEAAGHFFVGPDNGVFGAIADEIGHETLIELTEKKYFLPQVGASFHGRDIFAPVAAHLANGTALSSFGPAITHLERLDIPKPRPAPDGSITGELLWSDRFGNLVTNISAPMLPASDLQIEIAGRKIGKLSRTYSDAAPGELIAMIGSLGNLEIAVNEGSAAVELGAAASEKITVRPQRLAKKGRLR
jgi:S-adenosyl-L-methionine hydrolase (adenosine-forming)